MNNCIYINNNIYIIINMTTVYDVNKTHYMHISNNIVNNNKIGTKLYIKSFVLDSNNNTNLLSHYPSEKLKNRIIFSNTINKNSDKFPYIFLTKQNLHHNMKYIFKDNDFNKPRLIFTKYNETLEISNNDLYLFQDLTNYKINSQNIINTITNIINIGNSDALNYLITNLNYYKKYLDTDFFYFKLHDLVYKNLNYTEFNSDRIIYDNDICNNKLTFKIKNVDTLNNFSNNDLINYNSDYFNKIYQINTDNSINLLQNLTDFSYNNDNLLLFNILDNITTINFNIEYNNNEITQYNDVSLNFFVLKGYDYNTNKILIHKDYIYLNTRVLGYNNNFYNLNEQQNKINNKESIVYLSLGNSITGLTQHDIYNNVLIKNADKKIYFSKNIIPNNAMINSYKNNYYLLDENYQYNYNNILYNNYVYNNIKKSDINLNNYYDFLYITSPYITSFNNIELLNNLNTNYFDDNFNINNIKFVINDISYDNQLYKLNLENISSDKFSTELINKDFDYTDLVNYDFRFNYSKQFNLNIKLNITYDINSAAEISNATFLKNINNNLLLNLFKLDLTSYIQTIASSDFTNVNCVLIYYDQDNPSTPDEFKYPNNNIDICNNTDIDSLSKAIVNLPGLNNAFSNHTFVPSKNGSNLSRKQIEGYIGLNNIPKLLSIKPYDPNFIVGRGQTNVDTCTTYVEKIEKKAKIYNTKATLNSNEKVKTNNFANVVRSRGRNRLSQQCINNLQNNQVSTQIDYSKVVPYTPFKLFRTGKGHYLAPG